MMRPVQYVSWALIGVGVTGLIFYALKGFFTHPEAAMWAKALVGLAVVGFILLLGYVIYDRYRKARKEPKDIREVKH